MAVGHYESHPQPLSPSESSSFSMKIMTFMLSYLRMIADIPWISWFLSCTPICEKTAPKHLSLPTVDTDILTGRSGIDLGRQDKTWVARKRRTTMRMTSTTRMGVVGGGGRNQAPTTGNPMTWERAMRTMSHMGWMRMMR